MAGKVSGHGKVVPAPRRGKVKAPRSDGMRSHEGRRRRAASLHRSNLMTAHYLRKQRRSTLARSGV